MVYKLYDATVYSASYKVVEKFKFIVRLTLFQDKTITSDREYQMISVVGGNDDIVINRFGYDVVVIKTEYLKIGITVFEGKYCETTVKVEEASDFLEFESDDEAKLYLELEE